MVEDAREVLKLSEMVAGRLVQGSEAWRQSPWAARGLARRHPEQLDTSVERLENLLAAVERLYAS